MQHIIHLETTSITYDGHKKVKFAVTFTIEPKRVLSKFAYKLERDAKQFFADMVRDGEAGDIVTRAINKDLIEIEFVK